MSSVTTSSSNFSSILDAALDSYAKQTGIDLTKHPSADKLQNCRCPDDVLQILSERESASKDHRDHYQTLIDRVRPVVQVVHAFSDVLGEAAGFVSSGIAFSLSDPIFTLPNRFHFSQQKRYLSELIFSFRYIYPLLLFIRFLRDTLLRQAAIGVSASYNALADLFECVANFLRRLHIYTEKISLSPTMSDIMIKIMVEVLSVLALATKQIKQGRLSK